MTNLSPLLPCGECMFWTTIICLVDFTNNDHSPILRLWATWPWVSQSCFKTPDVLISPTNSCPFLPIFLIKYLICPCDHHLFTKVNLPVSHPIIINLIQHHSKHRTYFRLHWYQQCRQLKSNISKKNTVHLCAWSTRQKCLPDPRGSSVKWLFTTPRDWSWHVEGRRAYCSRAVGSRKLWPALQGPVRLYIVNPLFLRLEPSVWSVPHWDMNGYRHDCFYVQYIGIYTYPEAISGVLNS